MYTTPYPQGCPSVGPWHRVWPVGCGAMVIAVQSLPGDSLLKLGQSLKCFLPLLSVWGASRRPACCCGHCSWPLLSFGDSFGGLPFIVVVPSVGSLCLLKFSSLPSRLLYLPCQLLFSMCSLIRFPPCRKRPRVSPLSALVLVVPLLPSSAPALYFLSPDLEKNIFFVNSEILGVQICRNKRGKMNKIGGESKKN